jgi:ABC-type multidrug transport system permease subunit
MSEGQIIYHGTLSSLLFPVLTLAPVGPTTEVLPYFASLGYSCPQDIDVADFLQELPTTEGRRFITKDSATAGAHPPVGTAALSEAFKHSQLYQTMLQEMDASTSRHENFQWPQWTRDSYATSVLDSITHCLHRQIKLTLRDKPLILSRFMQAILIGSITGSLFNNTPNEDTQTLSGMLFFDVLFCALTSMSMIPVVFQQRQVFYKHSRALFYPTISFTIAQTLVLIPIQIIETIIFCSITYWSVGMSSANNGQRFLTFLCIVFAFNLCATQYIRLIASVMPTPVTAQPLAGVGVVLMVLFSGYIIPKSSVSPGWVWYYWLNPLSWALKSVTVNEYLSSDYDWMVCLDPSCATTKRFGDVYLESRGNPVEQQWVWYGFAVIMGEFLGLILITSLALSYLRVEPTPPPPPIVEDKEDDDNEEGGTRTEKIASLSHFK